MSNISLQNLENYKNDYTHGTAEIFTKYKGLITEYFIQCIDNLYIKNVAYYKYILIKGVETLTHVFKILLLYTKNLPLTYAHCQKSLYYYVEFICQIGDDAHSFLQLSTKDASLFVYKKTIFDINNEYRKEFASVTNTCDVTTNVDLLVKIYYNYISIELQEYDFTPKNKMFFIKNMNSSCNKLSQNILNLSLHISDEEYTKKLIVVDRFNELILKHLDHKNTYAMLFTKKMKRKNLSLSTIERKFISEDNEEKIRDLTPTKYINWLLN